MQRNGRILCSALCALALAAFLVGCSEWKEREKREGKEGYGGEKTKLSITRGVDVFHTSTSKPTSADFAAHPIPANFFCPGSQPFSGTIPLQGVPLQTTPPGVAGNGDTVVERLKDGHGNGAKIPVKVRALQLRGSLPIDCGGTTVNFDVDACLCGDQPTTEIRVKVDQACGCGHFDGKLRLKTCLRFTETSTNRKLGPVDQWVDLTIANMPWCPKPGPGQSVISAPFDVNASCDGAQAAVHLPGTSDFFPFWTCSNQGVPCLVQFASLTECHSAGPGVLHQHCTNPVCGERPN
jgi:hypothetical protein